MSMKLQKNFNLISEKNINWILNNATRTNGIACGNDLAHYTGSKTTGCPTKNEIVNNVESGYTVTISGSYSSNQLVKFSNISYSGAVSGIVFPITCDIVGINGITACTARFLFTVGDTTLTLPSGHHERYTTVSMNENEALEIIRLTLTCSKKLTMGTLAVGNSYYYVDDNPIPAGTSTIDIEQNPFITESEEIFIVAINVG